MVVIDEVAAESGFDVLASFVGKSRSRPELVKRLLRQGRVDALLLLNLDNSADLDAESVEGLPIVLIEQPGGTYWRAWDRFIKDELIRDGLVSPEDVARAVESGRNLIVEGGTGVVRILEDLPA